MQWTQHFRPVQRVQVALVKLLATVVTGEAVGVEEHPRAGHETLAVGHGNFDDEFARSEKGETPEAPVARRKHPLVLERVGVFLRREVFVVTLTQNVTIGHEA